MLDIKLIRMEPDKIRKNLERRGNVGPLDELVNVDKEWREALQKMENLRATKNKVSLEIAKKKDQFKIKKMREVSEKIGKLEQEVATLEEKEKRCLHSIPNLLHDSVPDGAGEQANKVVRTWGKQPKFKFPVKDHIDIGEKLGMINTEQAAKTSAARFWFLKGALVKLDYAIMMLALDTITSCGYTAIEPPYMINRKAYEGVVNFDAFEEMIYKIDKEDLYLIATSEHPMGAMHMGDLLKKEDLPLKYAGISPCFRKEAGAHGRDTKGIIRGHQFNKVEQFVFCTPSDSWKIHEELIGNAEEVFKKLELPYRVAVLCSGETGSVSAKTYDLEVWLPGQGKYREAVSCSNCTDYQARRLNVKYLDKGERTLCHTLNSTAVATSRALPAILENFQREDGTVAIPKALQKYLGGQKLIEAKKH